MALYIVGAGGVGREAFDLARTAGRVVAGFIDDRLAGEAVCGLPVRRVAAVPSGGSYLIAIADPTARARFSHTLDTQGAVAESLTHPRAVVAEGTVAGPGCLIQANTFVSCAVRIGSHCQIHYNATVGHDAVLGDRVTVYPGANVSGSVELEDDVTVGSNAVVLQGLVLGAGSFVGAGSVVTRDVAPGDVMVGAPARPTRRTARAATGTS